MTEAAIKDKIMKFLRTIPRGFAFKVHGSPMQMAGMPDILFWCWLFPKAGMPDRLAFAFEVKRPGEKPTRLQTLRMEELAHAGVCTHVVTSVDDVRKFLADAGVSL